MKNLMQLLRQTLLDIEIWCSTDTTLDFKEIEGRVEHEGLQFLTITLPAFSAGFERSLKEGVCDPSYFPNFKRNGRQGPFPRLFSGLVGRVFDDKTGILLGEPCIHSIRAIRQVCSMWKKIRVPCSVERTSNAYARFVKTNEDCIHFNIRSSRAGFYLPGQFSGTEADVRPRDLDGRFIPYRSSSALRQVRTPSRERGSSARDSERRDLRSRMFRFIGASGILWDGRMSKISGRIQRHLLIPRHGPGATAERIRANAKFALRRWHSRLDALFPACEYAIPNYGHADQLSGIEFVPPGAERPVRVVTVPKTHKTPRIIAIEPVCMQYIQQALLGDLVSFLESDHLTCGHINFTDQTVNQKLALESSRTGRFATIDLSDASDRVPSALVWHMLAGVPLLREAVFACRSLRASVPGNGVIPIGRFASMGSALCFPIEAMVFYTIVIAGMARHDGRQLSLASIKKYRDMVYVYGDDIIIPVEYVQTVTDELEGLNLLVNHHKSFEKGNFRESCGVDAYAGELVTPVYVREMFPTSRQDVEKLESWVSLSNQLYEVGYWRSSAFIRQRLEPLFEFPIVDRNSSLLGWHSWTHVREVHRYNQSLFSWETRSLKRWSPREVSALADSPALMKCLLLGNRQVIFGNVYEPAFIDPMHLQYSGRPRRAYTKIGWAS